MLSQEAVLGSQSVRLVGKIGGSGSGSHRRLDNRNNHYTSIVSKAISEERLT